MPPGTRRARGIALFLFLAHAIAAASCGGGFIKKQYEYEEELYLALDGSATIYLNASAAALVALRGVDLSTDPLERLDRDEIRRLFDGSNRDVNVTLSRREGRRFVHVRVDVDDVRELQAIAPFAWSTYRFDRRDDIIEYRQAVGPPAGKAVGDVGWDGTERVAFRMHLPSEIFYENADSDVQRGNILEWEQPLAARLQGEPLRLEVHVATESILYTTLLLFGSTIVAVAVTFGVVLWWVARRGRETDMAESVR